MLQKSDPEVYEIIRKEERRQQEKLSMIPSENFFSPAVREAVGSVFMHKYAEGNVGARYYEGNEYVDQLETLAIERARRVFNLPSDWTANVQALSGSNANLAVYLALLQPGDLLMGMYLPDGGHLSHGWSFEPDQEKRAKEVATDTVVYRGGSRKVNISSRLFNVIQYKTDPATRRFNYDAIAESVQEFRPQLIVTGGTAYPRDIDYQRMRAIADLVGAWYLADIAHEAGLIAAGVLPTPVGIADVVTLTTHKTLRSGRGAIIFGHHDIIAKVNKAIMPGLQGGPHNHNIAGICVGLAEAATPEFRQYAAQTVANAKTLAHELVRQGFTLVTDGTDKHLVLVDLTGQPLLGKKFARALDVAGIVTNANSMPQETRGPADPSALRLGTPWITGRGMGEGEMQQVAAWLAEVMKLASPWADLEFDAFTEKTRAAAEISRIAQDVRELCARFPLPLGSAEMLYEAARGSYTKEMKEVSPHGK